MTYLTVKTEQGLFEVKADRSYRAALDSDTRVSFDRNRIYLFDTETGQRLR
jgi:multiple sugar transport system ATP-binding protein